MWCVCVCVWCEWVSVIVFACVFVMKLLSKMERHEWSMRKFHPLVFCFFFGLFKSTLVLRLRCSVRLEKLDELLRVAWLLVILFAVATALARSNQRACVGHAR